MRTELKLRSVMIGSFLLVYFLLIFLLINFGLVSMERLKETVTQSTIFYLKDERQILASFFVILDKF